MAQNLLIIVQARMGSSRLPGKVLKPLCGQPMLLWQLDRLAQVQINGARTVVAVAQGEANKEIVEVCMRHGYEAFMPKCEEWDVLSRYVGTAWTYKAEHIIRVTADCPLIDPMVVSTLWAGYLAYGNNGYMGIAEEWPDGQDCEVFSVAYLQEAHEKATAKSDREHVTPYMKRENDRFEARVIACPFNYGEVQYSVDTKEDHKLVEEILCKCLSLHGHAFGWREIAEVIRQSAWIQSAMKKRAPRNHSYHDQVWRESGGTTVHIG